MSWLTSITSRACSSIYNTASQGVQYALDCGRSVMNYASDAFSKLPIVSTCQQMKQKVDRIYDDPTAHVAESIKNSFKDASLKKSMEAPASENTLKSIESFLNIFLGKVPFKDRIVKKVIENKRKPSSLSPEKQAKVVSQLDPLITEENAQKMGVLLFSAFTRLLKGIKEAEETISASQSKLSEENVKNILFTKLVGKGSFKEFKKETLKKIESHIDSWKSKIVSDKDRNAIIQIFEQIFAAFIAFLSKLLTPRLINSSNQFLSKQLDDAMKSGISFNLLQLKGIDLIKIDFSKEDVAVLKERMSAYGEVLFYSFANQMLSGLDTFDGVKAGDLDSSWQSFTKELQPALSGTLQASADRLSFISKMTLNSAAWVSGISYTEDPGKILQKIQPSQLVDPLIKGVKQAIRE